MRSIHVPGIFLSAKVYRSMRSGCSGTLYFKRCDKELVLKPFFAMERLRGCFLLHVIYVLRTTRDPSKQCLDSRLRSMPSSLTLSRQLIDATANGLYAHCIRFTIGDFALL